MHEALRTVVYVVITVKNCESVSHYSYLDLKHLELKPLVPHEKEVGEDREESVKNNG